MNIVSASDERYLPGLWVTWGSLLHATPDTHIKFYLLHDGISESTLSAFEEDLKKVSLDFEMHFIELDNSAFTAFPDFFFESKMPYARLMIPELVDADKVIYVDTDFLFLKGLDDVWGINMGENLMAVCLDFAAPSEDLSIFYANYPLLDQHRYFNSGLLLLNLKQIREENIFKKALNLLSTVPEHCRYHDQTVLNVVCAGRVSYVNPNNNYQLNVNRVFSLEELPLLRDRSINLHYVTSDKPWICSGSSISQRLFSLFTSGLSQKKNNSSRFYSSMPVYFSSIRHLLKTMRLFLMGFLKFNQRVFYWKLAGDHWRLFRLMGKEAWSNRLIVDVLRGFDFHK